ncbi:10077_t:CDS:1, partial [Funneliformis caledonium]
SDEIMETYMISVQTDESFDESKEKEIQWHISSPENSMKENDSESYFEQELINQFENHLLITVGYQCPKDEMIEIYKENIKVKQ